MLMRYVNFRRDDSDADILIFLLRNTTLRHSCTVRKSKWLKISSNIFTT